MRRILKQLIFITGFQIFILQSFAQKAKDYNEHLSSVSSASNIRNRALSITACSGNFLTNSSFEMPVQSGNGNHILPGGVNIQGWRVGGTAGFNIVVPGGSYPGGPNTSHSGSQYLDIASSAGIFTQIFDLSCASAVDFGGYFSSREPSGYINWTAKIEILNLSGTVIATSTTRNFTSADADGNPGDAIWYYLNGSIASIPAGRYIYKVTMGDYGNFDDATLCVTGCYKYPNIDGDLLGNVNDIDDDNDGIIDTDENGGFDAYGDADNDGIPNCSDATPGTGQPAFTDANSDGINDFYDADKDSIINSEDLDSDNDGIADIVEAGGVDTDGDGSIDNFADSDNDGLGNTYDASTGGVNIANLDTDGDGIPNSKDSDSDNDGIPDVLEAGGADTNNDGKIDSYTTDTDKDGFADSADGDVGNDGTAENTAGALIITGTAGSTAGRPGSYPRANLDGNGMPNPYDLDADGDGITDAKEGGVLQDTNNNGVINASDTGFTDSNGDGWSDQVDALNIFTPVNSEGLGKSNYLDIDSDDDGIVDNIEAQTTTGYIAPAGADTDGDGIDNAYDNVDTNGTFGGNANNGLTPVDTDSDTVPDYKDFDSDDDAKIDRIEGWDTNGNGRIDGAEKAYVGTTDTDGDGLLNEYDNVNGAAVANNVTNNNTPSSFPDVNIPGGDRDWRQKEVRDTDKDGIPDPIDLDDDNDGIPDAVECPSCNTKVFQNGGFEIPVVGSNTFQQVDQSTVTGWNTTATDGRIEIWGTGYNGVPSASGNGFAEVNGTQAATLYQNFCLNGTGATILWSIKHRGRTGVDVATLSFGYSTFTAAATFSDGTAAWGSYNGIFTVGSGLTNLYFALTAVSTANGDPTFGNFIDDIKLTIVQQGCDTDGDGIPDSLDLDSDNDGIPDIVEAGGIDTNGDGVIDNFADSDGDGLGDTYDATTGGVNIANLDTDGDGVPNYKDVDSDNDGIPDVLEAGAADTNNDGRIDGYAADTDNDGFSDSVDGDVGNDGVAENTAGALIITSTVGSVPGAPANYPRANNDYAGLPNPYDLDADGDGITDMVEAGINGSNGIASGTTGSDGWSDTVDALATLTLPNTDGRGKANYLDIDSDDDGISDNVEGQSTGSYKVPSDTDADNDGIADCYEVSTGTFGGGGITPYDNDADGIPDYKDTDTDNDGSPDINEASRYTTLNQGNINTTDTDGDGLVDEFDPINISSLTAGNRYLNITNSNMGANGTADGPTPTGSNVKLVKSSTSSSDRDWRSNTVLPLQIVSFSAVLQGSSTLLKWKVENEQQVSKYVIERSFDGVNYTAIGVVNATNSSTSSYSFVNDVTCCFGSRVYYRIQQVSKSGEKFYSVVHSFRISNAASNEVNLYPNPVKDVLNISLNSAIQQTAMVKISDQTGKTVLQKSMLLVQGANVVQMNLASILSKGFYIVQIKTDQNVTTQKITVL